MSNTGTWALRDGVLVKVSDEIPRMSRYQISGSRPFCERNGEVLDFGDGPHYVADAAEKRAYMQKHGVSEYQGGARSLPRTDLDSLPTFKEHFHREHGVPLQDAQGLVHRTGE